MDWKYIKITKSKASEYLFPLTLNAGGPKFVTVMDFQLQVESFACSYSKHEILSLKDNASH